MKQVLKRLSVFVLAIAVCVSMFAAPTKAETVPKQVEMNGFHFTVYIDDGIPGSVWLSGYTGSETDLKLPTHIIYENKKLEVEGIEKEAFAGNTSIKKVIIPDGYISIGSRAFDGCSGITEMVITGTIQYASEASLVNIPNCKTYRFGASTQSDVEWLKLSNIAEGETYGPIRGVTAYVVKGNGVEDALNQINTDRPNAPITIKYEADPAKEAKYTRVLPENGKKDDPKNDEPKNPYEKGASYDRADKSIKKYSSEKDLPGSVYGLLQLKQKKVKKNAIKVAWKKVPGAVKYAYYATNCGPKNKYVKHGITTGSSFNYKKICGKKLKKGKYYKFIVIAIDAKNKVASTSKTVHVATKGGKVTNDKRVKTKVKKNKKTIKVKKKFKIKAKEVKPKKGKVKRHRPIKYESANPAVATVTSKGVVKGVKKGKTSIYAYAQNGVSAKVKVTVK